MDRRVRHIRATFLAILIASTTIAFVVAYWYRLGLPATVISVMLGGGAPAGLYLAWEGFLVSFLGQQSHSESDVQAQDADELAESILNQWSHEEHVRQFNDYSSLTVTWAAADPSLTVSWRDLVKLARDGPGRPAPPSRGTWASSPDELTGIDKDLPTVLRRVPTGWLVVLGGPGAGKSTLMIRVVLDMLGKRRLGSGEPVPVLVPVATWDPAQETLHAWLEKRLSIDHPGLAKYVSTDRGQQSRIVALLTQGKIIPILDGLDEMPAPLRRRAIARLNDLLALPTCPPQLLITCRIDEYRAAVGGYGKGWIPLRGAAAIELQPLAVNHVEAYLTDGSRDDRWDAVIAELGKPGSAVAQALRTPLYVSLAAAIYNPHPDDPEELTSFAREPRELVEHSEKFVTAEAVQEYLLDEFIYAAYRYDREKAKQAADWLGFLAVFLESVGETSLQWWKVRRLAPRWLMPLMVGGVCAIGSGFAATLGTHVGVGIGFGFGTGMLVALAIAQAIRRVTNAAVKSPGPGMAGGLAGAAIGGLLAGVAMKLHIGHDPSLFSGLPEALGMGIGAGASSSRVGGFVGALTGGLVGGLLEGVGLGLPAGIANGLGVGLAAGLAVAILSRDTPARRSTEWQSRLGIAGGVVVASVTGLIAWREEGIVAAVVEALLVGAAASWPIGLWHTEQKLTTIPSPGQAMLRDAKAFWSATLAGALAAGTFGFIGGSMTSIYEVGAKVSLATVVGDGLGIGLSSALVIGLTFGLYHAASPAFLLTSWWLALQGKTPWRLKHFLDEAYNRSVLRQAGADYEFRHEILLSHLASNHRLASRRQAMGTPHDPT